jgi:hypothetical protein
MFKLNNGGQMSGQSPDLTPGFHGKQAFDQVPKAQKAQEIRERANRVKAHLSTEEVKQKIQTAVSFRQQQKWLVVYNALVNPRSAAEIAKDTGTSIHTVHQVISNYNRLGEAGIENSSS